MKFTTITTGSEISECIMDLYRFRGNLVDYEKGFNSDDVDTFFDGWCGRVCTADDHTGWLYLVAEFRGKLIWCPIDTSLENVPDLFSQVYSDAVASSDRDAFVSNWSLSSVWGDEPNAEIPSDRITYLGSVWDAAHATIKSIAAAKGMSVRAFAEKHLIPQRTAENWSSGVNAPPAYLLLALQEAEKLFRR